MSCNCGLNEIFTDKLSEHDARKFRRRGLDKRARRMLRALEQRVGLRGRSTLEVGLGAGGFTIELLRRGASRAVGVDAVDNQLRSARQLAQEAGVAEKLQLKHGDFTDIAHDLPSADVVVLDRVVCCYPDWRALLENAASHAQSAIVMSYPRNAWYARAWVSTANAFMRLLGRTFRLHLHPPDAMQSLLRGRGFTPELIGHRGIWEMLIAQKA